MSQAWALCQQFVAGVQECAGAAIRVLPTLTHHLPNRLLALVDVYPGKLSTNWDIARKVLEEPSIREQLYNAGYKHTIKGPINILVDSIVETTNNAAKLSPNDAIVEITRDVIHAGQQVVIPSHFEIGGKTIEITSDIIQKLTGVHTIPLRHMPDWPLSLPVPKEMPPLTGFEWLDNLLLSIVNNPETVIIAAAAMGIVSLGIWLCYHLRQKRRQKITSQPKAVTTSLLTTATHQGDRSANKDRFKHISIDIPGVPDGQGDLLLLGDGHGKDGGAVAEMAIDAAEREFPKKMLAAYREGDLDIHEVLRLTFNEVINKGNAFKSGCTFIMVFVPRNRSQAHVCAIGDPMVLIKNKEGDVIINPVHTTQNPAELKSVLKRGVFCDPEGFICDGSYPEDPSHRLPVTRVVGNFHLDHILNRNPAIYSVELGPESYIGLGSDGVARHHKPGEIRRFIRLLEKGISAENLVARVQKRRIITGIIGRLIWKIIDMRRDNATAIVLQCGHPEGRNNAKSFPCVFIVQETQITDEMLKKSRDNVDAAMVEIKRIYEEYLTGKSEERKKEMLEKMTKLIGVIKKQLEKVGTLSSHPETGNAVMRIKDDLRVAIELYADVFLGGLLDRIEKLCGHPRHLEGKLRFFNRVVERRKKLDYLTRVLKFIDESKLTAEERDIFKAAVERKFLELGIIDSETMFEQVRTAI